jgi:hypothetical protein
MSVGFNSVNGIFRFEQYITSHFNYYVRKIGGNIFGVFEVDTGELAKVKEDIYASFTPDELADLALTIRFILLCRDREQDRKRFIGHLSGMSNLMKIAKHLSNDI